MRPRIKENAAMAYELVLIQEDQTQIHHSTRTVAPYAVAWSFFHRDVGLKRRRQEELTEDQLKELLNDVIFI